MSILPILVGRFGRESFRLWVVLSNCPGGGLYQGGISGIPNKYLKFCDPKKDFHFVPCLKKSLGGNFGTGVRASFFL